MAAVIAVGRWCFPSSKHCGVGRKNFDQQRVALRLIGRMHRAAITTGACAQCAQKINLGKELKPVTGAHGTGLHKILACVAGETCAHKNVEHIVNMRLCLRC